LDVGGGHQIRTYTVGGPPTAIAVGPDAVWVASEHEDAIYALDPLTGSVRTSVDVGAQGCNGPASIAINQDGVWVACAISRQVIRIDPSGGTVAASLPVSAAPVALTTAADGSVWVAVQPS